MVLISFTVMLYYNMILAWTLYYMWVSFSYELPWQECQPPWATPQCFSSGHYACLKANASNVFHNASCFNASAAAHWNLSEPIVTAHRTPGSEYFECVQQSSISV